jgi:hypothetical protein
MTPFSSALHFRTYLLSGFVQFFDPERFTDRNAFLALFVARKKLDNGDGLDPWMPAMTPACPIIRICIISR